LSAGKKRGLRHVVDVATFDRLTENAGVV